MRLGGLALVVAHQLGHVRAVAPLLGHHHAPVRRVLAQLTARLRGGEELLRQLQRDAVRGGRFRQVGALVLRLAVFGHAHLALDIRPVAADTHVDVAALGVLEEFERVDLACVDAFQVGLDDVLEPAAARHGLGHVLVRVGVAEVEAGEPLGAVLVAVRDLIQLVFHGRGEVVVHQRVEVILQKSNDGERNPAGHQRVAAGDHVAAVLDRLDDAGIRRRAANAQVFHLLDQAGLVVARRRVGGVLVGAELRRVQRVALVKLRQVRLLVVRIGVRAQPAGEGDGAAGGGEFGALAAFRLARDGDLGGVAARVRHLGCHGALPDQLVELELLRVQRATQLARCSEALTRGTDRLVRLLRVLHLPVVGARGLRYEAVTVELRRRRARCLQALFGQGGRVRTHVRDVAVLVQSLRNTHRARGGEVQLAPRLLLQGRGHERCVRAPGVRLLLDGGDVHGAALQAVGKRMSPLLIDDHRLPLQPSPVIKVAPLRHALPIERGQLRVKLGLLALLREQRGGDVPVLGGNERHALALALHDHAGGHRLHATRGQARHDLLPQHRRDLVAIEAVQDAAGLLRLDQVHVQLAGIFGGLADRGLGDLVEDHALHRHLRLQRLQQVPRDRLTLTVGVCREQELVALLELGAQVRHLFLLVGADHVDRGETGVRVHAQLCPRLLLVLGGNVRSAARQVANVADRSLDDVILAQVFLDLLRLRRRLHDDQRLAVSRHPA